MSNDVASIVNEALDAIGSRVVIGDITEGTREAQVALRHYGQCLRQLLRSVHWDFCRQQSELLLLADATGQTADVGNQVIAPWCYEYAYPTNCMKARFIPANGCPVQPPSGNYSLPDTPLTAVPIAAPISAGGVLIPSPFLISMDTNYPVDASSNWMDSQGVSPAGRVVILSNLKHARLVFTSFMPYPTMWDSQFRAAMVAYLASVIALPLAESQKLGLEIRAHNIEIAKQRVMAARVTNGNESGSPQTVDHSASWMNFRNTGGGYNGDGFGGGGAWGAGGYGWNGTGYMFYGFDNSVF